MKKLTNKQRRKLRVRKSVYGTEDRPRLSIFKSNKHIYAQIINDEKEETLIGMSTLSLKNSKGTKSEQAFELGKMLVRKALDKDIKTVVFDRGSSKYHGRIKRVAEGAREAGLEF